MQFDYFYTHEAEQFAFYMVPKAIVEDAPFCDLSNDSKLLYSIVLDRVKLSKKNGWIDGKGRVYIVFTIEEIQQVMHCAKQKATSMMRELEEIGLLEKKRQGLGKPNILYVKNFVRQGRKSKFQKYENHPSGGMEITLPEDPKSSGINNNQNHTEFIYPESFFPSAPTEEGLTEGHSLREKIYKQIEYDCLCLRCQREQLDELVEIMMEVMLNRNGTIRIGRDAEYPTGYVQERFSKITSMHIERVLEGIADNRGRVFNTKAYLLASLFNSVSTLEHHNTMQYNFDFGGSF